jgi:hypothetical protein
MNQTITIRHSTAGDEAAMAGLAALDSGPAPAGEALLAFVGGELRVVLPLDGGRVLADPFQPTAALIELLRFSAARERSSRPARRRFRLTRPARVATV